jgi:glycosyltransferase involved in cell wall biosynthesis
MKVLHVIPSLWRGDGGPAQALRSMERALSAQGVQVETATTDDAGPGRREAPPRQEDSGVVHRYFDKRTDFYKVSPAFAHWIGGHVRDYDLLHIHALFSFTTTVAARAARRQGVPYVLRPLGTLDAWGLAERRPWLKRLSLRCIEGPLLRDAAAVHFTSEAEARQAQSLGIPMRAAVIPLGVDAPADAPTHEDSGTVRVLYLSRLAPKKNLEGLLEAFARVQSQVPRISLVIAGDGDAAYTRELQMRAEALGLAPHVEWLGRVEGEAKERAFARADLFALPSRSENFGIAAAEALARGVPCLLGQGVAIAHDVEAAGAGVAVAPEPSGIEQGLRLMIAPDARARMSQCARQLARERFSTEAMGARLKELYADLLAGRHGFPAAH